MKIIFVVTHPESFGFSIIECASAGALIVLPNGFIKKEITDKIYHVNIPDINNIDWNSIINKINIDKSINCAKYFSYETAVSKLYKHIKKNYQENQV